MRATALKMRDSVGIRSGNIIRCAGAVPAIVQKLGFVLPNAMMSPFYGLLGRVRQLGGDLKNKLNILGTVDNVRLTSIKLSGFKSFVDPTNFQVPGQLVGVVGPNGCGKSNIIDAVRWVLGESKASELRGESMQDVIFNGTTHRKPAGRSSVELVFDNGAGKAAGQWSQYAEIAVKRTLTRDGTSTYYINNQAVRRRDIQDIFLGTGLGPRAYAIIGQGMISRIIEARPEELRIFLEELPAFPNTRNVAAKPKTACRTRARICCVSKTSCAN
jgi:energy-coupling factor transporter ATP-binding protein EcfA2